MSSFADKNALQFTINLISIAVAANKTCGVHKWGGWGGGDKGLLMQWYHGPSMLLIGPICLRQVDSRHRVGLNIIHISWSCRLQMRVARVLLFQPAWSWALNLSVDGLGYFKITGLLSPVAQDCDTFVFWDVTQPCVPGILFCACIKKTKHNPSSHLKYK